MCSTEEARRGQQTKGACVKSMVWEALSVKEVVLTAGSNLSHRGPEQGQRRTDLSGELLRIAMS